MLQIIVLTTEVYRLTKVNRLRSSFNSRPTLDFTFYSSTTFTTGKLNFGNILVIKRSVHALTIIS